jgi:hypothetical protein
MKRKFFEILTVSLITLAILFVPLAVFARIWQLHLEFVNHTAVVAKPNQQPGPRDRSATTQIATLESPPQFSKLIRDETETTSLLRTVQRAIIINLILELVVFIPLGFGLGIFWQSWYRTYRSALFQKQVAKLEKLWQQSIQS